MTLPKHDNLDIPSLRELDKPVETDMHELQEVGRRAAIERVTAEANALGFNSLDELLGHAKRDRPRNNGSTQHEKERAL